MMFTLAHSATPVVATVSAWNPVTITTATLSSAALALTILAQIVAFFRNRRQDRNAEARATAEAQARADDINAVREEATRRDEEIKNLREEAERRNEEITTLRQREQRESERESREARAQAQRVTVINSDTTNAPAGYSIGFQERFWALRIENNSSRPIRDVRAGVRPANAAQKYAIPYMLRGPSHVGVSLARASRDYRLDALNGEHWCIFEFAESTSHIPQVDIAVRFVDDEGRAWQTSEGHPIIELSQDDWP